MTPAMRGEHGADEHRETSDERGSLRTELLQRDGRHDARERAHAHEASVAQAQLAGDADDEVERHRHDDVGADGDELALQRRADDSPPADAAAGRATKAAMTMP